MDKQARPEVRHIMTTNDAAASPSVWASCPSAGGVVGFCVLGPAVHVICPWS